MAAGSGTDRTVGLHVRRGDVQEGEAAAPVASNPSSLVSPDLAYNPGPARDAVSGPFYMHAQVWPKRPTRKILLDAGKMQVLRKSLQQGGFPLT